MRRLLVAFALALLAAAPANLAAQGGGAPGVAGQTLPRDVQRELADRWNGPNALKASDRLDVGAAQTVAGNVAVLHGPLTIAGHVTGNVVAINADVSLLPSATIDGDLLVAGGEVDGRNSAQIGGSIRIYRPTLAYTEQDGRLVVAEDAPSPDDNWWRRLEHRHEGNWSQAVRVVQAGPYNRVEGLPIELGPVINRLTSWGSVKIDAAAVVRTGTTFGSEGGDFGDRFRGEIRLGRNRGIGIGAQGLSVVDPVEAWQLSDIEVALASFLARRDYRDYYNRTGGNAFVTLYGARAISLTGSYGEERWSSRGVRNPFTIFNGDRPWRPNPRVDEGLFHLANLDFNFDTRTDPDDPWAGWFVNADLEHGRGRLTSIAPTSTLRRIGDDGIDDYTRGFVDVRRYNRLGPEAQLNMRVVLGGWLGGDELPLERRLSVDGPGTLPGFGFRDLRDGTDAGTCTAVSPPLGVPAECDRIALAQIEYRGDLNIDVGGWSDLPSHYHTAHGDVQWVLFADAGRGWNVGTRQGTSTYSSTGFPALSSFRSDVGVGLDVAGIGLYAAKAVSSTAPVNFFVRLRHRF